MPANDDAPRVCYSILTPMDSTLEFRHHAFTYDATGTAQKIHHEDLPTGYADCLENGLWPSLEVLPEAERSATGQAIDLSTPIMFVTN